MRGSYHLTDEDRRRFFRAMLEFTKPKVDSIDLVSTQLNVCNCKDLLEELDYNQECWETNGWEGEIFAKYTHETAPAIFLSADAYVGYLDLSWAGLDDGEDIDTEAFKQVMREKWGKYFPVI